MSTVHDTRHRAAAPAAPAAPADASLPGEYLQALRLIERLHRLLLDVIRAELDRRGIEQLNSVQALLLYNIGDAELAAGDLRTRGYYLGSNVSYNLKKLVEMGYIQSKRSDTDKRSIRISLTPRGKEVCDSVRRLYQRQLSSIEVVGQVSGDDLKVLNKALGRVERFWSDQIRFRL
jgi:DNA-binding MarR family transcriptional regulator